MLSGNLSIPRETFLGLGGFDEGLGRLRREDWLFGLTALEAGLPLTLRARRGRRPRVPPLGPPAAARRLCRGSRRRAADRRASRAGTPARPRRALPRSATRRARLARVDEHRGATAGDRGDRARPARARARAPAPRVAARLPGRSGRLLLGGPARWRAGQRRRAGEAGAGRRRRRLRRTPVTAAVLRRAVRPVDRAGAAGGDRSRARPLGSHGGRGGRERRRAQRAPPRAAPAAGPRPGARAAGHRVRPRPHPRRGRPGARHRRADRPRRRDGIALGGDRLARALVRFRARRHPDAARGPDRRLAHDRRRPARRRSRGHRLRRQRARPVGLVRAADAGALRRPRALSDRRRPVPVPRRPSRALHRAGRVRERSGRFRSVRRAARARRARARRRSCGRARADARRGGPAARPRDRRASRVGPPARPRRADRAGTPSADGGPAAPFLAARGAAPLAADALRRHYPPHVAAGRLVAYAVGAIGAAAPSGRA